MALSEIERARVDRAAELFLKKRRPPTHIRAKLDIACRLKGQSIQIVEVRPKWRGLPGEFMEHGAAKATFVRSRGVWRIYWLRKDLKWHSYEPVPEVRTIADFFSVVHEDAYCCFFG